MSRFHFYMCRQAPGQSVATFIARFEELSVPCLSGDNMLRDLLVVRLSEESIHAC